MATRTSWAEIARREQFAVVFPDGLNRAWADLRSLEERAGRVPPPGTDDVAFLARLVETFIGDGVADPKRVYVTGISNGGAMTLTMACMRPRMFAAAAAVTNNLTDAFAAACPAASVAVPVLVMNGTQDPLIPFQGGKGTSRLAVDGFWSTAKTLDFWRLRNGCRAGDGASVALPDLDPKDGSTVTRISSRCPPGGDVLLYRIDGGGHRWPGKSPDASLLSPLVNSLLGPQNRDIDGPEVIWDFFKRFERTPGNARSERP